jgi:UDP-glucuronate 4-epimerase
LSERFLITGALGCIGAWAAALLAREGIPVTTLDIGADRRRLASIMTEDELSLVQHVVADLTDLAALERVLDEHEITNVVHLAAMLIPLAKADPPRGAHVNVVGTVNVLEAVKRRRDRIPGLAYASSAAVYDERGNIDPRTHYGVYKLANEGSARVYWQDDGIASIGLRPFSVYGPGRDQGLTAGPTLAIDAAVRGRPYRIGFGGRTQLQFAPDVARAFVQAARSDPNGAHAFGLGGRATAIADFVAVLQTEIPDAEITFDEAPLPFPAELPAPWFDSPLTPLEHGIHETAETLRSDI